MKKLLIALFVVLGCVVTTEAGTIRIRKEGIRVVVPVQHRTVYKVFPGKYTSAILRVR